MLCPNCFSENIISTCPKCGYTYNPSTQSSDILSPGILLNNRYIVGRCIGQGGFGVTYIAKDTFKDEICAIKEYYPNQLVDRASNNFLTVHSDDLKNKFENGKKCFIDEAKVLFKLQSCPLIVTVTDFFSQFNSAYIVMDYLDGMNLKRALAKFGGRLSYNNAMLVLYKMCHALIEVHNAGILHRDISPENIFITNDGNIILIDFGAARNRDSEGMSVLIKPGYAPPEQYKYNGIQGPWTDIYALATTFYYIVSGRHIPSAKDRLIEDKVRPLCEITPNVNKSLSDVISKAMFLDYKKRYQTVEDFLNDIHHAVSSTANAYITFITGDKEEVSKINPNEEFNIGRVEEKFLDGRLYVNNKTINNSAVSGAHCSIHYHPDNDEFIVIDHSKNGTYFANGFRLCYGLEYEVKPDTLLYLSDKSCCIIKLSVSKG